MPYCLISERLRVPSKGCLIYLKLLLSDCITAVSRAVYETKNQGSNWRLPCIFFFLFFLAILKLLSLNKARAKCVREPLPFVFRECDEWIKSDLSLPFWKDKWEPQVFIFFPGRQADVPDPLEMANLMSNSSQGWHQESGVYSWNSCHVIGDSPSCSTSKMYVLKHKFYLWGKKCWGSFTCWYLKLASKKG